MYSVQRIISFFSDYFNKDTSSNLYKLIKVFSSEFEYAKETIDLMARWRIIDEAEGKVLDMIGADIKQPRGIASDDIYRIMLKTKIARNLSDGTINTVIRVIALAVSAKPEDVRITEGWEAGDEINPSIKMMQLPFEKLIESGIDANSFITLVKKTVAGGVTIDSIALEGTFTLGDANNVSNHDPERGLGDVNNPEVGGHFGLLYTSSNGELPI